MKNMIKYSNRFNILGIRSMSKIENSIFFALIHKLENQKDTAIELSLTELKSLIGISKQRNDYIQKALLKMAIKFSQVTIEYENKQTHTTDIFSVFEVLSVPNKDPRIKAKLSNPFLHIVNDVKNEFTLFNLAEYTNLTSKYSQTLYRLLKQYNSTGYYITTLKDLREHLNIPNSYVMAEIDRCILKRCLKEFNDKKLFNGLRINKTRRQSGKSISHIEFIFNKNEKSKFDELQQLENTTLKDTRYAESVANRQQILDNQKAKKRLQHTLEMVKDVNKLEKSDTIKPDLNMYLGHGFTMINQFNRAESCKIERLREKDNKIYADMRNVDTGNPFYLEFEGGKHLDLFLRKNKI